MFWCVNSCGYFTFFTVKLKPNAKNCRGITFLALLLGYVTIQKPNGQEEHLKQVVGNVPQVELKTSEWVME